MFDTAYSPLWTGSQNGCDTAQERISYPTLKTAATALPVTVDEVKIALDIPGISDFDDEFNSLIPVAVAMVENDCRRALMPQTWTLRLDHFLHEIELRRPPVTAVNSIKYYTGGVLTTISSSVYDLDLKMDPPRIRPKFGLTWPLPDIMPNAVEIEFAAGYATKDAVPRLAWQAIMLAMRALHSRCETGTAYDSLIDRLKWEHGI